MINYSERAQRLKDIAEEITSWSDVFQDVGDDFMQGLITANTDNVIEALNKLKTDYFMLKYRGKHDEER